MKALRTVTLCASMLAPAGTSAIVVRHDRSDADSLRLGARFEAVGRVIPDGACTLVAAAWAATAAHVAASLPRDGEVEFGGRRYRVKRAVLHPQGRGPSGEPPEVDLALLELSEPVAGVAPVPIYRGRDELGRAVSIVGYGDYGTPRTGLTRADGRRRAVTNVVDDAGPRRLFLKFDEPPAGSDLEGVGGPGDSGGPALLEDQGRLWLAGVSSASMNGKPGHYGVTDVYVRVSTYAAWIDETLERHLPLELYDPRNRQARPLPPDERRRGARVGRYQDRERLVFSAFC